MAVCDRRTYIQAPDLTGGGLPEVPTDPNDWNGLIDFLTSVCGTINNPESEMPIPGPVPNFALEELPGGVALTWTEAANVVRTGPRSGAYILYRHSTNDWNLSKALVTPHNKTATAFRWFDKWGQADPGTQRFYWVQAINQKSARSIVDFVRGPLTGPLVTVEP